ncbi:unnamed protein product [Urochloa decumbens]|uniref:KIB1-4 beta-propeller domain-containing protein n=1 Tax=Urochloa decumbens TaxID=240449 RepID=A0ABC9C8K5_9POAL
MANQEQPDWSSLPLDLLPLIGQRSRDAVTGVAAFRSVCRAWRAAVGPAPRLLLPRAGSEPDQHVLVFPLSRGWSVVVDARDASCHLSHLATGATAALPKLTAVRDGSGGTRHIEYEHRPDAGTAIYSNDMFFYYTYLDFADCLRFAVHVPPGAPAAAGMTVMMYHMMQGRAGMLFCRPGDEAWAKVGKPAPTIGPGFFDFAYHDGKMFGLESNGVMAVYDAVTLDVLNLVQPPPATPNLVNKMYDSVAEFEEFNYVHLVALPSKLVLVRTSVKSSRPVAFSIFELGSAPGGLAWLKAMDAGNYDMFIDGYHTTYRESGANCGTRIYYVHDEHWSVIPSTTAAYCYSMHDNKLECVYRSSEDSPELSTKPSWFVP